MRFGSIHLLATLAELGRKTILRHGSVVRLQFSRSAAPNFLGSASVHASGVIQKLTVSESESSQNLAASERVIETILVLSGDSRTD